MLRYQMPEATKRRVMWCIASSLMVVVLAACGVAQESSGSDSAGEVIVTQSDITGTLMRCVMRRCQPRNPARGSTAVPMTFCRHQWIIAQFYVLKSAPFTLISLKMLHPLQSTILCSW
ncbi:hypothetical protein HC928_08865, partial [bacterium]|nr:hypothetical protein [bacterium]